MLRAHCPAGSVVAATNCPHANRREGQYSPHCGLFSVSRSGVSIVVGRGVRRRIEDEFDEELLELFELELFDELELLFELEFREEFDELLELRLELQLPPSSRLERAWLLPLPVAFAESV